MKQTLRQHYRSIRKNLSLAERTAKSKQILDRLRSLSIYANAKRLLIYLAMPEEVQTKSLLQELLDSKNKDCFLTRMDGNKLNVHLINNESDLEETAYQFMEPKVNTPIDTELEYDCILIPGVSFDKQGSRIGMGKGYYDRLLKVAKGPRIGLGFEEQIHSEPLPTEDHDETMDFIITDQQLITLNPSSYGNAR